MEFRYEYKQDNMDPNDFNVVMHPVEQIIKIKYHRGIQEIDQIEAGDWIDLRAAEETVVHTGDYVDIPLGVSMQLPKGFEAIVAPRSSLFKRTGLIMANSIGIIDESYCGDGDEWHFIGYATRESIIAKNERICQFRIIPHQPSIVFMKVETLGNDNRGGIGSTGKL